MVNLIPKDDLCYWCGETSTSVEHVPPKCLFPEYKDTKGVNFRKNLLTVRSCDKHNLKKSTDDEFLMACLASNVGNNSLGYLHTITKVSRAFQRRSGSLVTALLNDRKDIIAISSNGATFPISIGEPDIHRLLRSLEAVARGLYRIEIGERFVGKCTILPAFIFYKNSAEVYKFLVKLLYEQQQTAWPKRGENPGIFYYQFGPVDQYGLIPLAMTFYGKLQVYASFALTGIILPFDS